MRGFMNYRISIMHWQRLIQIVVALLSIMLAAKASAFPFMIQDARSAAMGGTGVATDPRNAIFINPALLATRDEEYDWFAIVPSYHQLTADSDDLAGGLDTFLSAANDYFYVSNSVNQQSAESALDDLKGKRYRERNATAIALGIPSRVVSGAFYAINYENFTADTTIGTPDLNDPANIDYQSTLNVRGLKVSELGFSSAIPLNMRLGSGRVKLGGTFKMMLLSGIAYSERIDQSALELKEQDDVDRASTFNFDFGISNEVGVWKFGAVLKNVINKSVNFGNTKDSFEVEPMLKGGVAYRSRRTYFEVNADVTESQQLGFADKSQFVSAGWEYRLVPWLFLRAGVQHDFGGENYSTLSYGIGIDIMGYELDAAAITNEDEEGFYAQLTLKM